MCEGLCGKQFTIRDIETGETQLLTCKYPGQGEECLCLYTGPIDGIDIKPISNDATFCLRDAEVLARQKTNPLTFN